MPGQRLVLRSLGEAGGNPFHLVPKLPWLFQHALKGRVEKAGASNGTGQPLADKTLHR